MKLNRKKMFFALLFCLTLLAIKASTVKKPVRSEEL